MDFKEFELMVDSIKEGNIEYQRWKDRPLPDRGRGSSAANGFLVSWTSGGQTGGSCWDEGEHRYHSVDPDVPEELSSLDEILEKICPTISFLQGRRLFSLVEIGDYSDGGDYYGNYYTKQYKFMDLQKLYNFLEENKLLPDQTLEVKSAGLK